MRQIEKAERPLAGIVNINPPFRNLTSNQNRDAEIPVDAQIMMTRYDLQSNQLVANRMHRFDDGTVGLVTTWGQQDPNFTDRGTGYDYFDGTSWIFDENENPLTERVEDMKTGWPSYAPYGDNGELVVAHTGEGLVYYSRENKGEDGWQGPHYIPNPNWLGTSSYVMAWPRVVTTGPNHNILHVVAAASDDNGFYLFYSRSTDGETWTTSSIPTLEEGEQDRYDADTYAMAANGNTVAIMLLGVRGHGYIIKSTDNGETWTKTKFWDNPYADYDWETDENSLFGHSDETYINDVDQYGPELGTICIDNNGMVHGAFSGLKYAHLELGTSYTYWYGKTLDGIFYWNESMGTMQGPKWTCPNDGYVIESDPHNICRMWWPTDESGEYITRNWESANLIGFVNPVSFSNISSYNMVNGYFKSPSTLPTICVDESGTIGIAYSVIDPSREMASVSNQQHYRRSIMVSFIVPPYIMGDATGNYSETLGNCYYNYVKLQDADDFMHNYDEAIYPTCPTNTTNGEFWFAYQADDTPGLYCGSNAAQSDVTDNYIWATKVIPNINATTNYFTISAIANPTNSATITGAGIYTAGEICTITATPNTGFTFVNWTKSGTIVSDNPTYSFTVTESASYVANFTSNQITNHWTPIQTFENTMNGIGIVRIDGVEQQSAALELGIFCGDECRGSCLPEEEDGHWLYYFSMGGVTGETFTFRLYDHIQQQELDLTCSNVVPFEINAFLGDWDEPYEFLFTNSVIQEYTLSTGWNWWGTYIELSDIDGLAMLEEGLGEAGVMIKTNGAYARKKPDNTWFGSLSSINNETGYKVQTSSNCSLEMTGTPANPASHPTNINANGWTWIGYPVQLSQGANAAFTGFNPEDKDMVKGQNGFARYDANTGTWKPTSFTLVPGKSYLYFSNATAAKSLVFATGRSSGSPSEQPECTWKADVHAYPDNSTIQAVVTLDGVELRGEDYELGAFAKGTCRGSMRLSYDEYYDRYFAMLTVTGEDGDDITFGLIDKENDGIVTNCDTRMSFISDAIVGDFESPYEVRFTTKAENGVMHIYPNPVERNAAFTLDLPEDETVEEVVIYNALGDIVSRKEGTQANRNIHGIQPLGVYTVKAVCRSGNTFIGRLVVR